MTLKVENNLKERIRRIKKGFRLSKKLYGAYKREIFVLIPIGLLQGLFGALGIGALVPLFSLVLQKGVGQDNIVSRILSTALAYFHLVPSVPLMLSIVVLFSILKAVANFLFKNLGVRLVARYEARMRRELYEYSLAADWPYLLRQKIGYLENTLMTDVGRTFVLFSLIISFLNSVTSLLLYIIIAFGISPSITFFALMGGVVLLLCYRPFLARMYRYGREAMGVNKQIAHEVNENGAGLKIIKAMHLEKEMTEAGARFFTEYQGIRIKSGRLKVLAGILLQPLTLIAVSVFFAYSYNRPAFDLAMFLAVMYLIQQVFTFIDKIQDALNDMNNALPFAQNVLTFETALKKNRERDEGMHPFSFEKEIAFRNVMFSHGARKVLDNVNLSFAKGGIYGIIGPSGVGKTTLADLLLRLFRANEGDILVDGTPLANIQLGEWRTHIGYVAQEIFLKNTSIEENISFFNPSLTKEDIRTAARMANILDVIDTLPDGFETIVGERGVTLSAGQRQRIVLARILARAMRKHYVAKRDFFFK